MKTTLLFFLMAASGLAQTHPPIHYNQLRANSASGSLVADTKIAPPEQTYSARDPLREFDGKVYRIPGADPVHGWVEFSGTVVQVIDSGVVIDGKFNGAPGRFYVTNFPSGADGQIVGRESQYLTCYVAKYAGTATLFYGSTTLRCLDYGRIYVPKPPTPKEVAAAKAKVAEAKRAGAEKALAANQAAADKGDAYGLLRMGERYRDGEGVEKDLTKAKDYLGRAAVAGSPSATEALKQLKSP